MEAAVSSQGNQMRRLGRLADLIRRKLDREVAGLAAAQDAHLQSVQAHRAAVDQLDEARKTCVAKLAAGAEAGQWTTEHAWQEALGAGVQVAQALVVARERAVGDARDRVLAAHGDLERLTALLKRIEASHRIDLARLERKTEDDVYAAIAAVGGKNHR